MEGNIPPDEQNGRDDQHAHRVADPPTEEVGEVVLNGNYLLRKRQVVPTKALMIGLTITPIVTKLRTSRT